MKCGTQSMFEINPQFTDWSVKISWIYTMFSVLMATLSHPYAASSLPCPCLTDCAVPKVIFLVRAAVYYLCIVSSCFKTGFHQSQRRWLVPVWFSAVFTETKLMLMSLVITPMILGHGQGRIQRASGPLVSAKSATDRWLQRRVTAVVNYPGDMLLPAFLELPFK